MPVPTGFELQNIDHQLVRAIAQLTQICRALQIQDGKSSGLSPIQVQILLYLDQHSDTNHTLSDLVREFHTTKASLSESVQNLLVKKLIFKRTGKPDRRRHIISLTSKGKKLAHKARENTGIMLAAVKGLNTNNKQVFLDCLLKVAEPGRSILSLLTFGVNA